MLCVHVTITFAHEVFSAVVLRVHLFYILPSVRRTGHVSLSCPPRLGLSLVSWCVTYALRTCEVCGLREQRCFLLFFSARALGTEILYNFGAAKLPAIFARAHLIRGAGTGFIYRWYLYHHHGSSGTPCTNSHWYARGNLNPVKFGGSGGHLP